MVDVGDLVLEKIPANLSVDEKASLACGDISAQEWDLDAVAKARGRVKADGVASCVFDPRWPTVESTRTFQPFTFNLATSAPI